MYALVKSNPSYTIDKHGNRDGIAAESIISKHRTQAAAERAIRKHAHWADCHGASIVKL